MNEIDVMFWVEINHTLSGTGIGSSHEDPENEEILGSPDGIEPSASNSWV